MITSCYEEALDRIKWLEDGLKQIAGGWSEYAWGKQAQSILDGEPTTADEYNESQEIEGIELKHEAIDTMQEDEKLVFEEQFRNDIDIAKSMIDEIDKQLEEEE